MKYIINSENTYLIDDSANKEIDGATLVAKIKNVVHVDFAKTNYTVRERMDKTSNDTEVELVPESMDFLHKLTDIFPPSEYDYKIIGRAKKIEEKPFITIELQVIEKATGTQKWHGKAISEYSEKE